MSAWKRDRNCWRRILPNPARAILAAALLLAGTAFAQEAAQQFPIPGRGSLILKVPESWRALSRPIDRPPSVTGRMGPGEGNAFSVQVTALWLDEGTHCVEVHASRTLEPASTEAGAETLAAWFRGFREAKIESY